MILFILCCNYHRAGFFLASTLTLTSYASYLLLLCCKHSVLFQFIVCDHKPKEFAYPLH